MRYFNTSSAEKISKKPSRRPENPETYARPRWLTSNGEEIGKGRRSRVVIPRRVRILARVSVHACTSPSAVRWRTEAARSNDPPSPPLAASGRRLRLVLNQIRASLHSPTAPQALSRGGGRTRKEPRRKKKTNASIYILHPDHYTRNGRNQETKDSRESISSTIDRKTRRFLENIYAEFDPSPERFPRTKAGEEKKGDPGVFLRNLHGTARCHFTNRTIH